MNNIFSKIGIYNINNTLNINREYPIILGSSSPRRIELLKSITRDYKIIKPIVDEEKILENFFNNNTNLEFMEKSSLACCQIAYKKSTNIFRDNKDSLIISADTMVVTENRVLGKPKDEKDAYTTLVSLLGTFHYIITAVCLYINEDNFDLFYVVSGVKFVDSNKLSLKFIEDYVGTKSPLDKAGSYNIQEIDSYLIEGIFGDYLNIVGFPVIEIRRRLYENFS